MSVLVGVPIWIHFVCPIHTGAQRNKIKNNKLSAAPVTVKRAGGFLKQG